MVVRRDAREDVGVDVLANSAQNTAHATIVKIFTYQISSIFIHMLYFEYLWIYILACVRCGELCMLTQVGSKIENFLCTTLSVFYTSVFPTTRMNSCGTKSFITLNYLIFRHYLYYEYSRFHIGQVLEM